MKTTIVLIAAILFSTNAYAQFNWWGLYSTMDQINQAMALEQARRQADINNRIAAEALNLQRQRIANEKAAMDAMLRQQSTLQPVPQASPSNYDTMVAMIQSVQNMCNPSICREVNERTTVLAKVVKDTASELVYEWGPLFWDGSPDREKGMVAVLLGEVDRCQRGGLSANPRDVVIQFNGVREVVYHQAIKEAQLLKK